MDLSDYAPKGALSFLKSNGFYKYCAPNGAVLTLSKLAHISFFRNSVSISFASSPLISSTSASRNSSTIF